MKKKLIGKRGKFLTAILTVDALIIIVDTYSFIINGSWHNNPLRVVTYPEWYNYVYILDLILAAVFLIYIILWKKWAVYLSIIKGVLLYIFIQPVWRQWNFNHTGYKPHVLYHNLAGYNIIELITAMILSGLLYWAIYRKWKYFK